MDEPNPYEPPRVPEWLTKGQAAKRSVGLAVILLLTPPAMIIAVFGCCSAARAAPEASLAIAFVGPLAILSLLMLGAGLSLSKADDYRIRTLKLLLATPFAVVGAAAAGLGLGAAIVTAMSVRGGGLSEPGMLLGLTVFCLFTSGSLLTMLWLAWRNG